MAKKQYEIALLQQVKGSTPDDYESYDFIPCDNYTNAVKAARQYPICDIICYINDDISSYHQIFRERYEGGFKQWRWECDLD